MVSDAIQKVIRRIHGTASPSSALSRQKPRNSIAKESPRIVASTVQRDGKVAAGDHRGARHVLCPEHPQDVQSGRPVDK